MKIYRMMAISVLLYGCITWVMTNYDKSLIQACEMRLLRSVMGDKIPYKVTNSVIWENLNASAINTIRCVS